MIKKKFLLIFSALFIFCGVKNTNAQINPNVAIALNEFCVSNFSIVDNYGYNSDWVELYNAHTASVSLSGYYLSNDRANLYKWKFPSSFGLPVNGYGIVYLSGRDEAKATTVGGPVFYHANFNIDQCKNQWLILTTPQGVIRDSIYIRPTMAGHSRGRQDYTQIGINAWKLYPTPSFSLQNPNLNFYNDYLPMPTFTPNAGWGNAVATVDMFIDGVGPYDSSDTLNCLEIHYTLDGSVPTLLSPIYTGTGSSIILNNTSMVRAITFPKTPTTTYSALPSCYPQNPKYLPSFVQTNTYFDDNENDHDPRFGVLSIAMDTPDNNWLNSSGAYKPQVHVEYFDTKQQRVEGYAELYRPLNESWLTKQKGFYVTIDDRRGFGCNFEYPVFNDQGLGASSRSVFPTLHVKAGDFESHSSPGTSTVATVSYGTGIRDVFLQTLANKYNIDVNPLHFKPIIVFINGKYYGAYSFAEVFDKYYEGYYHGQPQDSVILQTYYTTDLFVQNQLDNHTSDPPSIGQPSNKFRNEVFDWANTKPMSSTSYYNTLLSRLDEKSFIDYIILNSYAMNSDIWDYNVAFARGTNAGKPGYKWHYYLLNTPSTFTFNAIKVNWANGYSQANTSPCAEYTASPSPSLWGGNTQGLIMKKLMDAHVGSTSFQLDYKNRYQDLLNGALRCDNVLKHYDYVVSLYQKEMKRHESSSSMPVGMFPTMEGNWDTNTVHLRKIIEKRCDYMSTAFSTSGCYGLYGPYPITVDVYPAGAGNVRLNSEVLPYYIWNGNYFSTQLSFKAIPTSTNYVFHHWEFKTHVTKNNAPLSMDTVAIDYNQADDVRAVFTDLTGETTNGDLAIPSGFTPNGDGNNDDFKPLGLVLYSKDYDFTIWNRWGQQVFRTTDPSVGWNGYYLGQQSQTGVYAYQISYKNIYNEAKLKKGNVTLVR